MVTSTTPWLKKAGFALVISNVSSINDLLPPTVLQNHHPKPKTNVTAGLVDLSNTKNF